MLINASLKARALNRQFTVFLKDFWLSSQPFEYSEYNAKGFSSSESEIGFPTWSLSRNMPGGQRFTALPSFLSCYSATADLTNKSLAYFGLQLNDHTFPAWKTILDHCLPQQPPPTKPQTGPAVLKLNKENFRRRHSTTFAAREVVVPF